MIHARSKLMVFALLVAAAGDVSAAEGPLEVPVTGPRIKLGEVVQGAPDVDLGPAPAPGGSRLLDREEMQRAAVAQGKPAPKNLPASVRVVRKMRQLTGAEIDRLATEAAARALARGVTLVRVRTAASLSVPDGWDHVAAELPRPPRRVGPATVSGSLAFLRGTEEIARTPIVAELTLAAEAAAPDVAQGSTILLLVRRGLVELRIPGVVTADAEIGSLVPVTVRPTGRVVRARILDREHALATEGP